MPAEDAIAQAVRQLARFPGVGQKTATRLVYWLLRAPEGTAREVAEALRTLQDEVQECPRCHTWTSSGLCGVCSSPSRDVSLVCVIEQPQDVLAIERSGGYRGLYHVLHGAISPLDGVGPNQLRIGELLERLRSDTVQEVILATDPDTEGDATALYLGRLLRDVGVRVTRLARGLPAGTELEYADPLSLTRAFEHRQAV